MEGDNYNKRCVAWGKKAKKSLDRFIAVSKLSIFAGYWWQLKG